MIPNSILLAALFICLPWTAEAERVYRCIASEAYPGGFDAVIVNRFSNVVENALSGLGLRPRVSVMCGAGVCPGASCARSFDYFKGKGCYVAAGRGQKILQAVQDARTYFEFILEDKGTVVSPSLSARLDSAHGVLLGQNRFPGYISPSEFTYFEGTPLLTATNAPSAPSSSGNGGGSGGVPWWVWLLVGLGVALLLLALLLACCCCGKKKGAGEEDRRAKTLDDDEEMKTTNSPRRTPSPSPRRPPPSSFKPVLQPIPTGIGSPPANPQITAPLRPGTPVQSLYKDYWYPATIVGGSHNFGYDVEWNDGTFSQGIPPYHIRLQKDDPNWVPSPY